LDRPASVNVGGHETLIHIGKQDELMNRLEVIGEFDRNEFTINVRGDLNSTYTDQIIAHEMLHAMFRIADVSGVDLTLEESLCHGLESVFYRFLVDNDLSWFRKQAQG
jgi:hypothetical protein